MINKFSQIHLLIINIILIINYIQQEMKYKKKYINHYTSLSYNYMFFKSIICISYREIYATSFLSYINCFAKKNIG